MLRILLVDDTGKDVGLVRDALAELGYDVVADVRSAVDLYERVSVTHPDVIIVDTESPTRDALEQLCLVHENKPRPVVMFAADGDRDAIRAAIDAGVTAYVVEGLAAHRVQPILEVAQARFSADRALREELAQAKTKLGERKVIERAKGLLMRTRALDEEGAYRALRRLAMDRQTTLVAVAKQVIDAAELLG